MKKTLLALLSSALLITVISPAQAEDQKVLAIIDTAINSSKHPSVIYEACFTSGNATGCPNKTNFMEGPGSASAPWPTNQNSGTYHGDAMVKTALVTNPNVKIVFVRYADVSAAGNSLNTQEALVKAIAWVSNNAEKYSIDAVSISQSSISSGNLTRCSTDTTTINAVSSLNAKNVPVFAATGNDGSLTKIGYPSCIPGVIATGALVSESVFEKASNRGPGIDAVAIGKTSITKYLGSQTEIYGTSAATVKAASSYLGKNTFTTFLSWVEALKKLTISGISYPYISN